MENIMAFSNETPFQVRKHIALLNGVNVETISANKTLVLSDSTYQILDGGGSDYDLVLPAENDGVSFWIRNDGATNSIVVKDAGATTITTLTAGQACHVVCDGSTWFLVLKA
jgi:hypothetical protein